MKIFWDILQGSSEWWEIRKGVPTASRFSDIITPAKAQLSKSADKYAAELASDVVALAPNWITEDPRNKPPSRAAQDGVQNEPKARAFYEMERGVIVRQCGFVLTDDGRWGCSPDGLVEGDGGALIGGLELKCPLPKTHAEYLLDDVLPLDYKCQVHGCLLVTGLPCWDFMSYCPGMPEFIKRVVPDEFTVKLAEALDQFFPRYMEIRKRILGSAPQPTEAP